MFGWPRESGTTAVTVGGKERATVRHCTGSATFKTCNELALRLPVVCACALRSVGPDPTHAHNISHVRRLGARSRSMQGYQKFYF